VGTRPPSVSFLERSFRTRPIEISNEVRTARQPRTQLTRHEFMWKRLREWLSTTDTTDGKTTVSSRSRAEQHSLSRSTAEVSDRTVSVSRSISTTDRNGSATADHTASISQSTSATASNSKSTTVVTQTDRNVEVSVSDDESGSNGDAPD